MTALEHVDNDQAPALLTDTERDKVIAYIEAHEGCATREAAEHAGVKRWQVKQLVELEPDFAERYREARGYGRDRIRQTIRARAIDGIEETTEVHDSDGKLIERRITRKSDNRLLLAMARAYLPEYRDTARVELTGAGGGPVQVEDRSATLVEVAAILVEVGALPPVDVGGAPREQVPGAAGVLAAPADG